jgi:hypothetical protein
MAKRSPFQKFPPQLENVFREGWTDNADVMSYLYTGTPALKTDFTRTGKRTYKGAMNDGINSVTRYYINNFTDGFYHDCLDFCTLKLSPSSRMKKRSKFFSPIKISLVMVIILTFVAKIMVESMILPSSIEEQTKLVVYNSKQKMLHGLVVFGTFLAGVYVVLQNGKKLIDDASRFV